MYIEGEPFISLNSTRLVGFQEISRVLYSSENILARHVRNVYADIAKEQKGMGAYIFNVADYFRLQGETLFHAGCAQTYLLMSDSSRGRELTSDNYAAALQSIRELSGQNNGIIKPNFDWLRKKIERNSPGVVDRIDQHARTIMSNGMVNISFSLGSWTLLAPYFMDAEAEAMDKMSQFS